MEVQVFQDLETLSHRASEIIVDISRECIETKKIFVIAISGGSTPRRLYTLLSSEQYRNKIEWRYVHVFWVDERCVPKEHKESNFNLAYETLISKVPLPSKNIHWINGEKEPETSAREYENAIKEFFGIVLIPVFDLIILGVGEDGHTASLFLGSGSLEEKVKFAIPVYIEKPKHNRITLTLPVLNNASQIIFLVSGYSKANIIQEILEDGNKKKQYPAGLIDPVQGSVMWLIDREAARKLTKIHI